MVQVHCSNKKKAKATEPLAWHPIATKWQLSEILYQYESNIIYNKLLSLQMLPVAWSNTNISLFWNALHSFLDCVRIIKVKLSISKGQLSLLYSTCRACGDDVLLVRIHRRAWLLLNIETPQRNPTSSMANRPKVTDNATTSLLSKMND